MSGPEVLDLAQQAIYVVLIVSAPMMFVALGVGLAIALLQALTQVQEMTLVFVPKIIAIFLTMLISLPFMAQALQGFTILISQKIISG